VLRKVKREGGGMSILDFYNKKKSGEKISVITCYDYTSARIIAATNIDCILVGDSVAMTMHGFKDTLSATLEMMCMHTAAVARGALNKFIVADLPFMSYRKTLDVSIEAVQTLMRAGANAVKLEGADGNLELIKHLTESGVPVMGHIGLTPQFVNALGGYKVQGKTVDGAEKLLEQAIQLQDAGCFSIVLECVPATLAKKITSALAIPTIGIGAGSDADGQVLVYQDLLGMNDAFKPKFVKQYVGGFDYIRDGINHYVKEIQSGEFPQYEHSYQD
jgi:3-methyl-2-oxobutanoate hydroxymethyltransferase